MMKFGGTHMATKRNSGSRPGLIRCDHCGEEYSASYRRCPFCDEYDEFDACDSAAPRASRSGGKRLAQSKRRGGGYSRVSPFKVIVYLFSLAVIVAAIYVVVTVIAPLIRTGDVDQIDPDATPSISGTVSPSPSPDVSPSVSPDTSTAPDVSPDVSPDTSASPSPSIPASSTANGFTLNKSEFSFTADYPDPVTLKVTFVPSGTSGTITWSSSNTNYATVDENGKVSRGAQKGTATITATLDNGVTQTCKVHNQVGGGSSGSTGGETTSSTASAKLNKTDFTFYTAGEKTQLSVRDYSGSVTWSSSNTSVATVSEGGICKAVGNGRCTITATLSDGTTLEAIARCSLS